MAVKPKDGRISPRDLAKALGVSLNQVQYAIQEGKLDGCWHRDDKARFRIEQAKAIETWAREVARAPAELSPEERAAAADIEAGAGAAVTVDQIDELLASKNLRKLTISEARRLELILKSKKLKLEYDVAAGARVLRTVVEKEAVAEAMRIRQALTALPSRLREQGLDAAMARVLDAEIALILTELANGT